MTQIARIGKVTIKWKFLPKLMIFLPGEEFLPGWETLVYTYKL